MRRYIILLVAMTFAMGCQKDASDAITNPNSTGVGGSTARFAITGDYLYTVDNKSLNLFNVSNPSEPQYIQKIEIGQGIETIFPKGKTLFIGSQFGMYIYDVTAPASPSLLCNYSHVFSCDPVVADDNYAYVTLRSAAGCGRNVNRLEIIDIKNLKNPVLVKTYPMVAPKGLAIDGSKLFICDAGLKIYDASDVNNLILKNHFSISADDVISLRGLLMVTGNEGITQYDYSNDTISFLSKLQVAEAKF